MLSRENFGQYKIRRLVMSVLESPSSLPRISITASILQWLLTCLSFPELGPLKNSRIQVKGEKHQGTVSKWYHFYNMVEPSHERICIRELN